MNIEQRRAVARLLLAHAGNISEHWSDEIRNSPDMYILEEVIPEEALQVISQWLKHLPKSAGWDTRLPDPK